MPRCLLCGENLGLGSFVARAMGLEMTCTQGLPRTGLILGSWCEDPAPSYHVLLGAASWVLGRWMRHSVGLAERTATSMQAPLSHCSSRNRR